MKKILLFLFFATIIQAQTITTSAPTRLDLVHYYSDKLLLEIGVADANGDGFDFTGYTGSFKIKAAEGATANLKNFSVTFTDSVIILSAVSDSLTSLRAPRLLFYELILNDGSNDKTWLAGKFNYTNRPSSSQISSLTLAYNTESLSVTVNGITNFSNVVSDSLVTRDSSLTDHKDAIDSLAEDVTSIPGMISDSIQNNSIDPDSLDDGDVLVVDNGNFVNYSPADLRYLLEIQKIDTTANDTTLYLKYNLALGKYESVSRWTLMDDILPPPLALDYLNVYYPWNIGYIAEHYLSDTDTSTLFYGRDYLDAVHAGKFDKADTSDYYKGLYIDALLNYKFDKTDTINYYKKLYVDALLAYKLNSTDTASLSNRINLKLNTTDTTAIRTFSDLKYPTKSDIADSNFVLTSETSDWDKDASNDITASNVSDSITANKVFRDSSNYAVPFSYGLLGLKLRTIIATTQVLAPNGTNSAPAYSFANKTNYGWNMTTAGLLQYVSNATPKITIDTTGSVGIGTTTPSSKLEVSGSIAFTPSSGSLIARSYGTILSLNANALIKNDVMGNGGLGFSSYNDQPMTFWTSNGATTFAEERMRITDTGNVGISTTTPGTWKLNVNGDVYVEDTLSVGVIVDRTPAYVGESAINDIKKIKGNKGEIDHSSLPEFTKASYPAPVEYDSLCVDSLGRIVLDSTGVQKKEKKVHYEMKEGRNVGNTVSLLVSAMQEQQAMIEELQAEILNLKKVKQ